MSTAVPSRIYYGAAYYPEVWPNALMEKDIQYMKELKMNVMRMAEFSWVMMEPEEGRFEFEWLERIIDRLHDEGIDVILGTPTATPPAWLACKHPEMFCLGDDGVSKTHGARRNCDYNSAVYRRYCSRIVEELARRFGGYPGIIAWQTDNEFNLAQSFSRESEKAWHQWLHNRYETIESLNKAWGTELWSQRYDAFDQIPMGSKRVAHHPSLMFNWIRFINDSINSFQKEQVQILRRYSSLPVMHNTMPGQKVDYSLICRDLDLMGLDCYHDYEHYWMVASNYDRMRGYNKGPHFLLETAPNNSGGNVTYFLHPCEGSVRAAIWMNHALGGQGSLFWLWRQHASGQEMTHGSVLNSWGKPATNYQELRRIGEELHICSDYLINNPVEPAKVAIMYSHEAGIGLEIEPYIGNMRSYYLEWSHRFYKPLQDSHIHRDVIYPEGDISKYEILFIPLLPFIPQYTRRALKSWVQKGGVLILGPMSGYRTEDWTAFTDYAMGDLEEWIGIHVESRLPFGTTPMLPEKVQVVWEDGSTAPVTLWGDILSSEQGEVLARHKNGLGDGLPAIIEKQVGAGKVVLLGTDPGPEKLQQLLVKECRNKGVTPVVCGEGSVVSVPRRGRDGKGLILVNVTFMTKRVDLFEVYQDQLTGALKKGEITLEPYQVLVLKELT